MLDQVLEDFHVPPRVSNHAQDVDGPGRKRVQRHRDVELDATLQFGNFCLTIEKETQGPELLGI